MENSGGIQASLAGRYASALFGLARDQQKIDAVGRSLATLSQALLDSKEFAELIASPLVSRDEAGKALGALGATLALDGRGIHVAYQAQQKGTAHAVQMAADVLAGFEGAVLILYGDTPFVTEATLKRMLERLGAADAPGVVVLGSSPDDPLQYGRIVLGKGDRIAIYMPICPEATTVRARSTAGALR